MKNIDALASFVETDVAPVLVDGSPFPEHSREASLRLIASLRKKWRDTSEIAKARAALTFLEANYLSSVWEWSGSDQRDAELLGLLRSELDQFLHPDGQMLFSSYFELFEEGRTGPGSAAGAPGQSFYAKLGCAKQLTTTSVRLYQMYRAYTSVRPLWEDGECRRASLSETPVAIVDESSMTFVPKYVTTERAICVEPSLNMFLQLGIEGLLKKRLKQFWGVDMELQPDMNRLLARIGSRGDDFATLDLSSASDLISWRLCEHILPEWFLATLDEVRVHRTRLDDFGLSVDLGMMSTMGNGFTFPVMTLILGSVIRAVYRYLGIPIRNNRVVSERPQVRASQLDLWAVHRDLIANNRYMVPGNWAVWGDDMIVCREAYDLTVSFLQKLGLQVNIAKSFNQGPFRESCGHDYFRGHNVRGVYLKRLTSRQDIAVAVNLLNDWTFRTGIPLRQSVRYLMEGIDLPFVPYTDPEDAGIRVPSSIFVGRRVNGRGIVYKRYFVREHKYRIGDGFILPPKRGRRWGYNGSFLLLSLLKGELRAGTIAVRHNRPLYRTGKSSTNWWDFMPASGWVNPRLDWRRWKSAVEGNLALDPEA